MSGKPTHDELIQQITVLRNDYEIIKRDYAVLEERDRKIKILTKHIPDVIWFLSVKELRIIFITPSVVKMLGYTPEEVVQIPFDRILTPASYNFTAQYLKEELDRVTKGLSTPTGAHQFEIEYLKKDGSTLFAEITATGYMGPDGELTEILGISRDISKQKRAEEALKKSEERYRTLFETSMDAIYISTRDGRFIEANPAAVSLFGFADRQEMLHTPVQDIYFDPDDRISFQDQIEKDGFVKDYPVKFKKIDGSPRDCLLTSNIWRSENGTVLGYQGIIRDISEQNRLKAQLLQAQKMEAVGTLAGGIAHNFNNILMTIQGNTSLMLMKTDSSHPHYKKLLKIEEYIQYGSELSNQLLGFARGRLSELKVIDVNRLLKNSAAMFSRSKREITIETDFAEDLWPVLIDPGHMDQVMMNLFVNAWQAMPGGGKILIWTRNITTTDSRITPPQLKPGRYIQIAVTDTGTGMDEETRQKIFDPFFTTKKYGEGTGLGLSTVYSIIKNHEGHITVYSEPGKGSTFSIFLPATEKETGITPFPPITQHLMPGTETILLVDDEEIIKETGQTMLEELGYSVLTAQSGSEGIETYARHKHQINLVVLDMIMPDMGGAETFERLRAVAPDVKILLSSGYGLNHQVAAILDRGCNGFIQKPFNLTELSQKVREVLDK